jgi:hypothetical protein
MRANGARNRRDDARAPGAAALEESVVVSAQGFEP